MDYIEIPNLEKYNPKYKDGRKIIWIRLDVDTITDYKLTSLAVNGRWLFICLTCLCTKCNNSAPKDITWLAKMSGIDRRTIPNLLKQMEELKLIVTKCNRM